MRHLANRVGTGYKNGYTHMSAVSTFERKNHICEEAYFPKPTSGPV